MDDDAYADPAEPGDEAEAFMAAQDGVELLDEGPVPDTAPAAAGARRTTRCAGGAGGRRRLFDGRRHRYANSSTRAEVLDGRSM